MLTSQISSVAFSATLTPLRSSPDWQRAILLLLLCATAAVVLGLHDAALRSVLIAALISLCCVDLLRIARQPPPPDCLRLSADGACAAWQDGGWHALELHPSSLLGSELGWLLVAAPGEPCSVLIVRRHDNQRHWRRARVIWRYAPAPAARVRAARGLV